MTDKKERGFIDTVVEILEDAADLVSLGGRIFDNTKSLSTDDMKNEMPSRATRISESRKKEKK